MLKRLLILTVILLMPAGQAVAFCGFYVARADTKLFNKASKVVMVRDGNRTVLTMANDFQGEPNEFAIVIPVPTLIEREQIHVANSAIIDHLDAYSAPRLVEYYDRNPCEPQFDMLAAGAGPQGMRAPAAKDARALELGVKIEAEYTVGEYDIVILSATQSSGLETWLVESGYRIPDGAANILGSYLKQGMRFFVAKVNLKEHKKLGFSFLRPLQVAYESPKFMLPIRLGMINADGPQELFVFALTKTGRVETTNYRTVKLPEGMDLPLFVKDDFNDFYRDMFSTQVEKENRRAVFLEYAWDMGWCDPCAAEPLSNAELKELGVFWLDDKPQPIPPVRGLIVPQQGANVFITRLHLRYENSGFPEDLVFQETGDRTNFQARYVMRHPWTGSDECDAAGKYREGLQSRQEKEIQTLANLTGWNESDLRKKAKLTDASAVPVATGSGEKWWKNLWK